MMERRPLDLLLLLLALSLVVLSSSAAETEMSSNGGNKLRGGGRQLLGSPQYHSTPICDDSNHFKILVGEEEHGCGWVRHDIGNRCDMEGTDTISGKTVAAKFACFEACGTGNC
jgi:hypothetical protein